VASEPHFPKHCLSMTISSHDAYVEWCAHGAAAVLRRKCLNSHAASIPTSGSLGHEQSHWHLAPRAKRRRLPPRAGSLFPRKSNQTIPLGRKAKRRRVIASHRVLAKDDMVLERAQELDVSTLETSLGGTPPRAVVSRTVLSVTNKQMLLDSTTAVARHNKAAHDRRLSDYDDNFESCFNSSPESAQVPQMLGSIRKCSSNMNTSSHSLRSRDSNDKDSRSAWRRAGLERESIKRAMFSSKRTSAANCVEIHVPTSPPQYVALVEGVVSPHSFHRQHYLADILIHGKADLLPKFGFATEVLTTPVAPGTWLVSRLDTGTSTPSGTAAFEKPRSWDGHTIRFVHSKYSNTSSTGQAKKAGESTWGFHTVRFDPLAHSNKTSGRIDYASSVEAFVGALGITFFDGFASTTEHLEFQQNLVKVVLSALQDSYEDGSNCSLTSGLARVAPFSVDNDCDNVTAIDVSGGVALPVNIDWSSSISSASNGNTSRCFLVLTTCEQTNLVVSVDGTKIHDAVAECTKQHSHPLLSYSVVVFSITNSPASPVSTSSFALTKRNLDKHSNSLLSSIHIDGSLWSSKGCNQSASLEGKATNKTSCPLVHASTVTGEQGNVEVADFVLNDFCTKPKRPTKGGVAFAIGERGSFIGGQNETPVHTVGNLMVQLPVDAPTSATMSGIGLELPTSPVTGFRTMHKPGNATATTRITPTPVVHESFAHSQFNEIAASSVGRSLFPASSIPKVTTDCAQNRSVCEQAADRDRSAALDNELDSASLLSALQWEAPVVVPGEALCPSESSWPVVLGMLFGLHDHEAHIEMTDDELVTLKSLDLEPLVPEFHDLLFAQLSAHSANGDEGGPLRLFIISMACLAFTFPALCSILRFFLNHISEDDSSEWEGSMFALL
jgi:hypothetical protein